MVQLPAHPAIVLLQLLEEPSLNYSLGYSLECSTLIVYQQAKAELEVQRNAGLTDFMLHLDKHLSAIIAEHGKATYAILFAIVFAETGFVLTPFLPGELSSYIEVWSRPFL